MDNEFDNENEEYNQNPRQEIDEDEEQRVSRYMAKRRLKQNRLERKVRKSRIWIERLRMVVRLFMVALLLFVGYRLVKCHQWYMPQNAFNSADNSYLEISENKIVPSYKILAVLRRHKVPTKPIYMTDMDEIKQNILKLEPIEDVYIRRFWWPARLQIFVKERTPIITISPSEKVPPIAFFTKDGKLIGRDYMPLDKSYRTILVLSYGVRGDDYRHWDYDKIKLIEKLTKSINNYSKEPIEYIDFRNPNDVYVKLKTAKIRLGVVDDRVFDRIKRIPSILPQVKTLDKKIKFVDISWDGPSYIKLEE